MCVIISGLPTATGYQLIVSGLASDGITGCSGSATFNAPTPSTGVPVTLVCAGPPAPGTGADHGDGEQLSDHRRRLGEPVVRGRRQLDGTRGHRARSRSRTGGFLTYAWSADGGTFTGSTSAATATFTCGQAGRIHVRSRPRTATQPAAWSNPSPSPARSPTNDLFENLATSFGNRRVGPGAGRGPHERLQQRAGSRRRPWQRRRLDDGRP